MSSTKGIIHMSLRSKRSSLAGSALVLTVALSGCGAGRDLQVHDNNAPSMSLLATLHPAAFSQRGDGNESGIELGYERYRASGTQQFAAGLPARVGDQTITGPDNLRNTATVQSAHVAYSRRFALGSHLQLEPAFGLGLLDLNFHAQPSAPASALSIHNSQAVAYLAFTPRWRFNEAWALEARVVSQGRRLDVGMSSYDVGVRWNPTPNLALRLGYGQRSYEWQDDVFTVYSVETRGPSTSLIFDF
jgi:hypothetical protein